MADMLKAALSYAERGWPIFPCRIDKTPYVKGGVLSATTDPKQIREWWATWPGANIAVNCGAANLLVIDYDPGADYDQVAEIVGEELPETRLVARTPRGGTHEYFQTKPGAIIASSQGRLGDHVDVRAYHGYTLLPPSRTAQGTYVWECDERPATATDALERACARAQEKDPDRDRWLIEPDLPENIADAIAWVKKEARPAIEGNGGDNATYAAAAMMKSYGLSEETASEVLWEHYNPRCEPPWEYDDLVAKVEHGYRYNTSPPGNVTDAYHRAKVASRFQAVTAQPLPPEGWSTRVGRFTFLDYAAMRSLPPPRWLVEGVLMEGGSGLIVGSRSTGKTFLALDLALSVACGVHPMLHGGKWTGFWPAINRPGPVLYVAGEGHSGIRLRAEAWAQHHGMAIPDCFYLSNPVPHIYEDPAILDEVVETLLDRHDRWSLVVLDTVGRAMQGENENAQEHASAYTRMVEGFQRGLGANVLGLHHTGHDHDRARGSSVFEADTDTVLVLDRERGSDTGRVTMTKQREAKEWDEDRYFRLQEEGASQVAVAADKPARTAARDQAVKTTLALVDEHVERALRANARKPLTDAALATIVAVGQEDTDGERHGPGVGEQALRKTWLPRIREAGSQCRSARYYDPAKGRWLLTS